MALFVEAAGGTAAAGAVRAGPEAGGAPAGAEVAVRYRRLDRILGAAVPPEEVGAILASLHMEVLGRDADGIRVRVPSWRGDVALEEDLVEEVARIRGYGCIPAAVSLAVRPVPPRPEDRTRDAVREALAGAGWHEALTLPFVAPGLPDDASPWTDAAAIRVDNPVRAEEPLLRRSLLGPLLRCLERNRSRGVRGARLFELAPVYLPSGEGARPEERPVVSGVAEGDYADARGALDALLEALGLAGRAAIAPAPADAPVAPLDPARTAAFRLDGRVVAWAGEVHRDALATLGVHREGLRAAAFEADLGALLPLARLDRPVVPVPVHPVIERDLAVVFPLAVRWAEVEAAARAAAGPLLRGVELFDEFSGRALPAGTRSLAFRLVLGADERTLRGEEADGLVAAVVRALGERLGGRLRS
jgi:phenylalanyl-tRNA synthetase beta chain